MEQELKLSVENNFNYLIQLDKTKDLEAIGFYTNEYLKMAALYWGLSALNLLGKLSAYKKEETIEALKENIKSLHAIIIA